MRWLESRRSLPCGYAAHARQDEVVQQNQLMLRSRPSQSEERRLEGWATGESCFNERGTRQGRTQPLSTRQPCVAVLSCLSTEPGSCVAVRSCLSTCAPPLGSLCIDENGHAREREA